jgi:hypothetical protein
MNLLEASAIKDKAPAPLSNATTAKQQSNTQIERKQIAVNIDDKLRVDIALLLVEKIEKT